MNRAGRLATLAGDPEHWLAALVLTALAYTAAGVAALPLVVPPGYAAPLYPAAGIALAAVLVQGPRMLPAVALGAFGVNLWLGLQRAPFALSSLAVPLAVALGATLQAWLAARLVQRHAAQPLTLAEPRDAMIFLLACAIACAASTSVSNLGLWLSGGIAVAELPFSIATWWIGDLLGTLIAAPVLLTLIARPREAWAPRRISVGLPLVLAALLLTLGIEQVERWNGERVRTTFANDAGNAALALETQLREPLQALESLHDVFTAADKVTPEAMRVATAGWLSSGTLLAMAWNPRVRRADLPAFEAAARADGLDGYRVFDSAAAAGPASARREELIPIRLIEPIASNHVVVGLDVLSIPTSRLAAETAIRTGQPVATPGFPLLRQKMASEQIGVVVYRALYTPRVPELAERAAALRGLVSVVLRMNAQLEALDKRVPDYLSLCLVDTDPGGTPRRLAGAIGCEQVRSELQHARALTYAGRAWELRVGAAAGAVPQRHGGDVWLFALIGLASTAMLGGFLLAMTGRTQRVEVAVRERTKALQAEVLERALAEGALRESEQRFRNILNHVPIGVYYTDLNGSVRQTNPCFCELLGYEESELLEKNLAEHTHPDDVAQDIELTGELVRGEIPMYRRHKRYLAKDGTIVWVQATVSLLRDAAGNPRSIVGVVENIAEQLKLEVAERAREAAEAANRTKSEFLSRMSHELRTPLNAILGFAQLLELDTRHPIGDAQRPRVEKIQQAGWHLLEMINDVLDLSRIDSGNLRLQLESLGVADLLAASVAMVEGEARQRGVVIAAVRAPEHVTVRGDATRVKQILTNLLSNAVKYNREGGRVTLGCALVGDEAVEITVADTGIGMTPKQLAELFQPFNRLGQERSTQPGTGIGLVISQRLAEVMGGSLGVHSAAGQGSEFVLTLPRADAVAAPTALAGPAPTAADYHRRLVHYIEDNDANVEVMQGILTARSQVELQVSLTGLDGLAAIRARPPDLVLLDMHLPDVAGLELLRHLKQDALTGHIPVVVVSADALAEQIDAAFAVGCSHYLTKPFGVREVLRVIDELLEPIDTRMG